MIHLLLLLLLAVFCLPSRHSSHGELLLSIADNRDHQLDEVSFEMPTLEVAHSASQLEPQAVAAAAEEAPMFSVPELADLLPEDPHASMMSSTSSGGTATTSGTADAATGKADQHPSEAPYDYRASFFGIPATGKKFVYVLDMSTSMGERTRYGQTRFQVAAEELIRSVEALKEDQEFYVVLFCYRTYFFTDGNLTGPKLLLATRANKDRLRAWLAQARLSSGTDPRLGVLTALRLRPDAVFLLSDGEFNGERKNVERLPGNPPIEQVIASQRRDMTPIHTIAFEEEENRDRLRNVAKQTGGTYRFVRR